MSEFKTQQQYVDAMSGMFGSEGWKDFFKPELLALRAGILEELIYGAGSNAPGEVAISAARASVLIIDRILEAESRLRDAQKSINEHPEEATNVVHSPSVAVEQAA